jgi:hypothetical protein
VSKEEKGKKNERVGKRRMKEERRKECKDE